MNLAVLGSTGSVGTSALEASLLLGARIAGISANRDTEALRRQIERFSPEKAVITDGSAYESFKVRHGGVYGSARILKGEEGLGEMIDDDSVSVVVNAISGIAGLEPTLQALRAGKKVATANKESIVMGWQLIRELIGSPGQLVPVDSEHSAVYQLLEEKKISDVRKIILTASGGAVYGKTPEELEGVTADDCLRHPTWDMGTKITVDSATLMNKGLEVIEACNLFEVGYDILDVVIHPQSIIHALVEFSDGSIFAHMAPADMKIPISYAISHPARPSVSDFSLGLETLSRLDFELPDRRRFPCLDIAVNAGRSGGTAPVVMCAADEAAVDLFLKGRITFSGIPRLISGVLEKEIRGSLRSSGGIEDLYRKAYEAAINAAGNL